MKKTWLLLLLLSMTAQIYSAALTAIQKIPVPVLGHYKEGYPLMPALTYYKISTEEEAKKLIPKAVKYAIEEKLPNPEFFISVAGTFHNVHGMIPTPWNILFHGWIQEPMNSNVQVGMGIFDAQGILGSDIGTKRLASLGVNPHTSDGGFTAFSPNNARCNPVAGREFISFGLIGSYRGKEKSIVIYQIIINNKVAQAIFEQSLPNTLQRLTETLNNPTFIQSFSNTDDQRTLEATIAKLSILDGAAGTEKPATVNPFGFHDEAGAAAAAPAPMTEEEQAASLGITIQEFRQIQAEQAEAMTTKHDEGGAPEAMTEEEQLAWATIESLKELSKETIPREYGEGGAPAPMTEEEQAASLGITIQEFRQIQTEQAEAMTTKHDEGGAPEAMTEEEQFAWAIAQSLKQPSSNRKAPPVVPRRKDKAETKSNVPPTSPPRITTRPAPNPPPHEQSFRSELEEILARRGQL